MPLEGANDETQRALVEWVRTFAGGPSEIASLEDLCDGILLNEILSEIAPHHFSGDAVAKSAASNWAIAQTNLKKIVKNLEIHFAEDLNFRAPFDQLDVASVAKEKKLTELIKILEFIAVAAIKSPDRARTFVERIMGLSEASQPILKALIEAGMQRTTPLDQTPVDTPISSAELEEVRMALRSSEEENHTLRNESDALKVKMRQAEEQVEDLSHTVETQRKRLEVAEREVDQLRIESDRIRGRFEEEIEGLRHEIDTYKEKAYEDKLFREKAAADKERTEKLEADFRRMADELDVAKAGNAELNKLQDTVEKYKQKLEQVATAKQRIKDLEDKSEQYIEQIMTLEDQVKSIPTMQKMIEQYKQEKLDLERARFEEVTASKLKEAEVLKLRDELETAQSAKRFLTDEISALRKNQADGQTDDSVNGFGLFEDASELKERCARLTKENKDLRKFVEERETGGSGELEVARSQLQDALKIKSEREQEVIVAKSRCADLEGELERLRDLLDERAHAKGAETEETIRKLRALNAQHEQAVATLRSDKEKLEQYIKSRLEKLEHVHKEYLATLTRLKEEKAELKERNEFLEEKMRKDKDQHKREERLLHSAFYEIGLDAFESRLSSPSLGSRMPIEQGSATRSTR